MRPNVFIEDGNSEDTNSNEPEYGCSYSSTLGTAPRILRVRDQLTVLRGERGQATRGKDTGTSNIY